MEDLFAPRSEPEPQRQGPSSSHPQVPLPVDPQPVAPQRRRPRLLLLAVGVLLVLGGVVAGYRLSHGGVDSPPVVTRIPAVPSALPDEAPVTVEASTAPAPRPSPS